MKKASHHKEVVDDMEYQRKAKRQTPWSGNSSFQHNYVLRSIHHQKESLPNQNINTIQNMSLAFDYTNSKSIPISIQPSKNYDGKKKQQNRRG